MDGVEILGNNWPVRSSIGMGSLSSLNDLNLKRGTNSDKARTDRDKTNAGIVEHNGRMGR
jgi:hypothetical protein